MTDATSEPRMIDLTRDDLSRMKDLTDAVWFDILPGGTPADLADDLDLRHARGVERPDGASLPGEAPLPEGSARPDEQALLGEAPLPGAAAPPEGSGKGGTRRPLMALYSAFSMTLTVPGTDGGLTSVPMDGLTWVSVHPDARRRGLLTRMMTDHLHRVHQRGEAAVAGLLASEQKIYGRYGYGCASLDVKLTLSRGAELVAPETVSAAAADVSTHMVTAHTAEGSAALHEAHLTSARATLGAVTRPDEMARTWWRDFPKARGSKEPRRLLLARRDGVTSGYAVFRRQPKWEDGSPQGTVEVMELGAADDASLLALVRRLVDLDLTSTVTLWSRSMEDPVMWWAGGPRSVGVRAYDGLWLRLVDVPRALTDRGYAAPCDVVVQVVDELCPWNARRWRLVVAADGRATCEETSADAALVVPVQALGAAYAGGRPLVALARHSAVVEHRAGALRQLSRTMRADDQPFGSIGF